ncbi:hypothetical protein [Dokdonella sp.]|uniref:hypothetical protein n=1 Tax=Dokdonella sp. TaxID=2291710 RepID=UPI003528D1FB
MTDGAHRAEPITAHAGPDEVVEKDPFAHAGRASAPAGVSSPGLLELAQWLPRLGPVLWLQQGHAGTGAQAGERHAPTGLLDHPASRVLSACALLHAHHAIAAHGPREWLCFHSSERIIQARLFLLPDSDVLEWDRMNAALGIVPTAADRHDPPTHSTFLGRALSRFGQRWQARLLEFRCPGQARLPVVEARPPLRISLLGIELARSIVNDEYAEWVSPQLG